MSNVAKEKSSNGIPVTVANCTERDILMGRGRGISNWPGNIFLRQTCNQYRKKYVSANRNKKVDIAADLVQEIHSNGCRFLDHDEKSDRWVTVDSPRIIEKVCQALRDNLKSNTCTPVGSPFGKKQAAPPRRKRGRHTGLGPTVAVPNYSATAMQQLKPPQLKTPPVFVVARMLERLRAFQQLYGHTAVPPGWDGDVALADWCTAQRQLYREVVGVGGYRRERRPAVTATVDDDRCNSMDHTGENKDEENSNNNLDVPTDKAAAADNPAPWNCDPLIVEIVNDTEAAILSGNGEIGGGDQNKNGDGNDNDGNATAATAAATASLSSAMGNGDQDESERTDDKLENDKDNQTTTVVAEQQRATGHCRR